MSLNQSIKNIDQVIANAPMTRYDHDQLKNDMAFLIARARLADELTHKEEERKEAAKAFVDAALEEAK